MPQETNLNVAPYFDDFDPQSNYYKVLFKPAYPVQARELNNLQSILQDQVENLGNHFFKEGAKVIPGQTNYFSTFHAVQINSSYSGISVSAYLDQLVGKKITGRSSGVKAKVVTYITDTVSELENYTLYVNYITSGSDSDIEQFSDGEILNTDENISFLDTFISSGEGFAQTLSQNATATGSAFGISQGIYFLRGHFVDIFDELLILDQYSNRPSYRIGFFVKEELISSANDQSLTDNAQGFNNYTAPGADRLKITATLAKKAPDDFNDQNFVQIAEVKNGTLRHINKDSHFNNNLKDELARRTFDESGHYYIKEFLTVVRESLNNGYGNRGIYNAGQLTEFGNVPSDDLGVYKISPGKAYVRGFEVDRPRTTFLDFEKPRTTKKLTSQGVNFGFGPTFSVNRVNGSPNIGFNTDYTLSLRDERVGVGSFISPGNEIGMARVYDFSLESGSYESNLNLNKWDLSLFDVQTYVDVRMNEPHTLSVPTFVEGQSSGATGFIRYPVEVGVAMTVYGVSGDFHVGEKLVFNGIGTDARTSVAVTAHTISDVQSVFGITAVGSTFTADIVPTSARVIGIASITARTGSPLKSIVTSPGLAFAGITTIGDLVSFSVPGQSDINFARVTEVNTTSIGISTVASVAGICSGLLNIDPVSVSDFTILKSNFVEQVPAGNAAGNNSLYSVLQNKNIESIDVSDVTLDIRRSFNVTLNTSGESSTVSTGTDEVFLAFDEERYSLTRSDGAVEPITSKNLVFASGNQTLRFVGLSGIDDPDALLITTIRKSKIKSKTKVRVPASTLVIDKSSKSASGSTATSLNDGLTFGNYPYGTRVQDRIISLNVPDVRWIYGIFEANESETPTSPNMTAGSLDGPTAKTDDLILGEDIIGQTSGAQAVYVGRRSETSIDFIYENDSRFLENEIINFQSSGISGIAADVSKGSKNITSNFNLDGGFFNTHYDYSRIVRKPEASVPTRKIKVYFLKANYNSSDTGDITTVNSYNDFNYTTEISETEGTRHTDIIDFRPRVNDYSVSQGSRSPLEFLGRSFLDGNHSSADVVADGESIILDYSYYLPRIDSIFLSKDGEFIVKKGTPTDFPIPPGDIPGALNIAKVSLPAYLYTARQAQVEFIDHKRYQMNDIGRIEKRLANVEYFTSLSRLENNVNSQFVPDANGLDRFKNGFFTDNFADRKGQDSETGIRNSIDRANNTLRPAHYCTAINLQLGTDAISGIGTVKFANDPRYANILGDNIARNIKNDGDVSNIISLNYSEVEWLKQSYATRTESVTPFLVRFYQGTISLDPTADVWIQVNELEVNDIVMMGSLEGVASALQVELQDNADGTRSGVSPVIWGAWETTGVDVDVNLSQDVRERQDGGGFVQGTAEQFVERFDQGALDRRNGVVPSTFQVETTPRRSLQVTTRTEVGVELSQRRRGTQNTVREVFPRPTSSFGNRVVRREIVHKMRSRNIEFNAKGMKSLTRVYPFFDNIDISRFCTPKLLEIEMVSGTFEVGEQVRGAVNLTTANTDTLSNNEIVFVLCQSNHRYGDRDNPTDIFTQNPYNRDNTIPTTYSESSTILNIDTKNLADENFPETGGNVVKGMNLVGQTSGAQARVSDIRLITDQIGVIIGSYRVPDTSADTSLPAFDTGRNTFRLTSSPTNSKVEGLFNTAAEEIFYSQGDLDQTQEVTLALRNAVATIDDSFEETRNTVRDTASDLEISEPITIDSGGDLTGNVRDPLAQTFDVDDKEGIFVTSIDIFFQSIDFDGPVEVEIREVELGLPVTKRIAGSLVVLDPGTPLNPKIQTSNDGTVATKVKFDYPIYLSAEREYAVVLLANVTDYRVWISRLGEIDVTTINNEESAQTLVSTQPLLGSLFKSQSGSTWTPSQYEDLKFTLYRADFVSNGNVQFFNQNLPQKEELISKDAVEIIRNEVRVGLGSTLAGNIGLEPGVTITQKDSLSSVVASGKLISLGSSVTSDLTITNAGIGYTPFIGGELFEDVSLTSLTGTGKNATANITVINGVAVAATISNGGVGYQIGDELTPTTIGADNLGSGIRFSVANVLGDNELRITDVQGEFNTTANNFLFFDGVGVGDTSLNGNVGGNLVPLSPITEISDGNHMKIFHRNHGMHGSGKVTLRDIESDTDPSKLTVAYPNTSSGGDAISVSPVGIFTMFENIDVSATNPGYIKIGNEIISYTGTSGSTLTSITRGVDNTKAQSHAANDAVFKYEIGGVSLRRVNKTHTLSDATVSNPITLDSYHIKVGMNTDGTDRSGSGTLSALKFSETKSVGGVNGKATYNIPFEIAIPKVNLITPTQTNITASMRTVSGSSIDGTESSYVDQGFEEITLNATNYFTSTRIVASKINETTYLSGLPGSKSLSMNVNLSTSNSKVSPMIDLDQASVQLISNRINSPITNFATDSRVNNVSDDPSKFIYCTKLIKLENPSTSLKVILDSYVNQFNDVRVLYAVNQDKSLAETVFTPFPGYNNMDPDRIGVIINPDNSDGSSDKLFNKKDLLTPNPGSQAFSEMQFTIDRLPTFNNFRIKIIGTSTNQAYVPNIKNLRVLALA